MAELKKVIYSIERCTCHVPDACRDCAYDAGHPYNECVELLLKDALSLLKAQEPILLENQHRPYGHVINVNSPWISRCPRCGKKVEGKQTKFCKYCGQAVKWG